MSGNNSPFNVLTYMGLCCAGSKPVATSQFVTHSQPTLNAVWKKPVADLKRAQRPAPAKMGTDPAPVQAAPACLAPDAQSAEGLDPPSSPAISPPKPGEVCTALRRTFKADQDMHRCCSTIMQDPNPARVPE